MPNIFIAFIFVVVFAAIRSKRIIHICFLGIAYFFSLRSELIPDTEVYMRMYEDPFNLGFQETFEYVYLVFCYLFKSITGANFSTFYFVLTFICLELWVAVTNKLFQNKENINEIFLLFISFYGFFYLGVTIRNAVSLLVVYYALVKYIQEKGRRKTTSYCIWVLIASFFHISALIYLFLIPIYKLRFSSRQLIYFWGLSVFLLSFSSVVFAQGLFSQLSQLALLSKLEGYTDETDMYTHAFSLQTITSLLVSLIVFAQKKYIDNSYRQMYNIFTNINLVGLIVLSLLWMIPVSYRFYGMFFFFNFVLLYLSFYHNVSIKKRSLSFFFTCGISIVYFFSLIYCNSFLLNY